MSTPGDIFGGTSGLMGNNAAEVNDIKPPSGDSYGGGLDFDSFDVDSFIPAELRDALAKHNEEEEKKGNKPEEVPVTTSNTPAPREIPNDAVPSSPPPAKAEEESTDDAKSKYPIADDKEDDEEGDDQDLSPESIDKLLKGDLDAVVKKKAPATGDDAKAPFWHEDKDYKALSSLFDEYDLQDRKAQVDALIQKVADKHIVDNSTVLNDLKAQLEAEQKKLNLSLSENARLRQVERGTFFDSMEDTKQKFHGPMQEAAGEVLKIMNREGVNIPVGTLMGAKSKGEFLSHLSDFNLDEKDQNKMLANWRAYRDTQMEYSVAKEAAMKNGAQAASTNISPETLKEIFSDSLTSLGQLGTYKYINEAMLDGISKHKEVETIVNQAGQNLSNFIAAMQRPGEHVRSHEWMSGFSKFLINAEHNRTMAEKYAATEREKRQALSSLSRVVSEYRSLLKSAGGISGVKGLPVKMEAERRVSAEKEAEIAEQKKLEEFQKLMEDPSSLGDIIPQLKF